MKTLGVIVGRFQTDKLTKGHKRLINLSLKENDKTIIFLGNSPLEQPTARNPFSLGHRMRMIRKEYPDITILSISDHPDDRQWSENLDTLIEIIADRKFEVAPTLYHCRDSFAEVYTGEFPLKEVELKHEVSATERRIKIAENPAWSKEFARGVIYATHKQWPTVYSCVDGAVTDYNYKVLLLIRKENHEGYMFPGGFAETGATDEEDVLREIFEETSIEATSPHYVKSFLQDDWRYRSERDEIRTRLFHCYHHSGVPRAGDDAAWAGWVGIASLKESDFNPCHRPLFVEFKNYIEGQILLDQYFEEADKLEAEKYNLKESK